jgi:hypothetical protein
MKLIVKAKTTPRRGSEIAGPRGGNDVQSARKAEVGPG